MKEFDKILTRLRFGALADEMSDKTEQVVAAAMQTGKPGSVTLKLSFKPGKKGYQMEITDTVSAVIPEPDKESTLLFANDEGELLEQDPRQGTLEGVRSVTEERRPIRDN